MYVTFPAEHSYIIGNFLYITFHHVWLLSQIITHFRVKKITSPYLVNIFSIVEMSVSLNTINNCSQKIETKDLFLSHFPHLRNVFSSLVACSCLIAPTVQPHLGQQYFVLMYSGIVNGYQLLCDVHTVLKPHRGTAAFFYFACYRPFPLFLIMCLSLWQSYFFSWVPL